MSFNIFQTNTTAYANQMMENFYYLGGNRQPYTTTAAGSLTAVDATYDLGSSSYRWDDVYTDNLHISNEISSQSNTIWMLVSELSVTSTTNSIEIAGLNGDESKFYKVIIQANSIYSTTNFYWIICNNDSASNYGYHLYMVTTSTKAIALDSTGGLYLGINPGTTSSMYSETILDAETGYERMAISTISVGVQSNTLDAIIQMGSVWDDTSNTLTSLLLYCWPYALNTGTSIQVWKRG